MRYRIKQQAILKRTQKLSALINHFTSLPKGNRDGATWHSSSTPNCHQNNELTRASPAPRLRQRWQQLQPRAVAPGSPPPLSQWLQQATLQAAQDIYIRSQLIGKATEFNSGILGNSQLKNKQKEVGTSLAGSNRMLLSSLASPAPGTQTSNEQVSY